MVFYQMAIHRFLHSSFFADLLCVHRKDELCTVEPLLIYSMNQESLRSIDIKLTEEIKQLSWIEEMVPECVDVHTPH